MKRLSDRSCLHQIDRSDPPRREAVATTRTC